MVDGIICVLLGIIILVISTLIVRQLRNSFSSFYKKHRCFLTFATVALSLPIIVTGVFIFSIHFISPLDDMYSYNKKKNPPGKLYIDITLWFIGLLIPVCVQLASLIFGFIRKNSEKNQS